MVKNPSAKAEVALRHGFDSWVRKIPWRRTWRTWRSTPVLLPGESHGQRSLAGYSPWGCRVGHDWWHTQQPPFLRPRVLLSLLSSLVAPKISVLGQKMSVTTSSINPREGPQKILSASSCCGLKEAGPASLTITDPMKDKNWCQSQKICYYVLDFYVTH